MLPDLVETIKKIALSAVASSKPVEAVIGSVIKEDPLEIRLGQKLYLGREHLLMYDREIPFEGTAEVEIGDYTRKCPVSGVVRNSLRLGDVVALLRVQGGQKYIVLGRIGS